MTSDTDWGKRAIAECTEIVSGGTPKTSVDEYWGGEICWATPKDLSELSSPYISDTPRKVTQLGLEKSSANILPEGSVLFSSRAPIGHVAINTVPMATNQGFKSFIPNADVLDAKFLYWWLRSHRSHLQALGNGATFKEVSKSVVSKIRIPTPPVDEQKRIAEVLDRAEALRARRRAALALLDELTQSIFLDMFGDPVEPKCDIETLGDHVEFMTTGGRGWAKYYCDQGARFVRSLDVQMNHISDEECVFVNPPDSAEARRTRVSAGDVLLTMTGSRIGRVSKAPDELNGAYISQHVAIVRLKESLEPEFLSRFLSLEHGGQIQIRKWQYGQTKPGLNFRQVKSFQVPVPNVKQQRSFVAIVEKIEKQKKRVNSRFDLMDDLFASLQSRAFKGELFGCSRELVAAD